MILNQTVFADEALMLPTEFRRDLLWMSVTIDLWQLEVLLDLLFSIFVGTELDRFENILMRTVIRVTE
jgi:hypothetical protein